MKIYKLLASLLLPALAIFVAALAQHILVIAWPGIREIRFPIVTADSYFDVLLTGFLCFLAGVTLQRHVGSRTGFACAVIMPLAFLCVLLWSTVGLPIVDLRAKIAWFRPITLFIITAAILPLMGLALGWSYSGSRRRRATSGNP